MAQLVKDNFHGANGTALAAHAPQVGGPWTSGNAGWRLEGNQAQPSDGDQTSSISLGNKPTARARVVFDMGNLGGDDTLRFQIADDDENTLTLSIFPGELDLSLNGESGPISFGWPGAFDAGQHTIDLNVGPGTIQFGVDGNIVMSVPRAPSAFGKCVEFSMDCHLDTTTNRANVASVNITN